MNCWHSVPDCDCQDEAATLRARVASLEAALRGLYENRGAPAGMLLPFWDRARAALAAAPKEEAP